MVSPEAAVVVVVASVVAADDPPFGGGPALPRFQLLKIYLIQIQYKCIYKCER